MVDFVLTKDVNHALNDDYLCLLVQFKESDKHFHEKKINWMPKDSEVLDMVRLMILVSPTFKNKINEVLK